MASENRRQTLLTALVCVLIVAVAALTYMVFEANAQISGLAAANQAALAMPGDKAKDTVTVVPKPPASGQGDTWRPFSTPFDPKDWDPFNEMSDMQRRIDAMFNDAFGRFGKSPTLADMLKEPGFTPRMDLVDKGDHYIIRLDVPGAKESEINVSIEDKTLTVDASSKVMDEKKEKDDVILRERQMGRFERQIALPGPVDDQSLQTEYKDGVLTITVNKASQ